jgi:hypothetical protein
VKHISACWRAYTVCICQHRDSSDHNSESVIFSSMKAKLIFLVAAAISHVSMLTTFDQVMITEKTTLLSLLMFLLAGNKTR